MKKLPAILAGFLFVALLWTYASGFGGMGPSLGQSNASPIFTGTMDIGTADTHGAIRLYNNIGSYGIQLSGANHANLASGLALFWTAAAANATQETGICRLGVNSLGVIRDIGFTTYADFSARKFTPIYEAGSEVAPALTAGNWTVGAGWESPIVGPGLIKNADGTGTQTTSAATAIVAGTTYKVVITLSAQSVGSASYTLGGVTGASSLAAATTYTDYITATTTGKIIITPTNTSRFTISAISYKPVMGGLVATTTNDLAPAGSIGEYFKSFVAVGTPVALTNNTVADVTSIALTAGDWDVEGNVNLSAAAATITASQAGFNMTSATLPTDGTEVYSGEIVTTTSEIDSIVLPRKRFSLSGSATVYMSTKLAFSAGGVGSFGSMTARRVR